VNDLALPQVRQHGGQPIGRDPPLAIRISRVGSAILSGEDFDTSREQMGVTVIVSLNHGLADRKGDEHEPFRLGFSVTHLEGRVGDVHCT